MSVPARRLDRDYTLEHKYTRSQGRIYLSGVQALVRLPLMQQMRDRAAGLNTVGFISGYRGSPLGGFDLERWKAKKHLAVSSIEFQPDVNEDLGTTMVWGTQQATLFPGAKYDGVFSMWYGNGPVVDRCGDVFKHANAAGTGQFGGVRALAANDHACRSSTLPHGSELGHGSIDWWRFAPRLQRDGELDAEDARRLRLFDWYGALIANSDMHLGNAALQLIDQRPLPLAPIHDIMPMRFRPASSGKIVKRRYEIVMPTTERRDDWGDAARMAQIFWCRVAADLRVSAEFRAIASDADRTLARALAHLTS